MNSPFSAAPQSVGYLYQVRYALYSLLREDLDEAAVKIEGLDDIELTQPGGSINLEQLKHHIKDSANLTNTSEDLWKTIRIWATQLKEKRWDPSLVRLSLLTTGEAPEKSIAWYLKDHAYRDILEAQKLMHESIKESKTKNKALLKAFSCFQDLNDQEQKILLGAIVIIDKTKTIDDLVHLIKLIIRIAAPPSDKLLDQLYEELEGWWFGQAIKHLLNDSQDPISLQLVRTKLWSITDRLKTNNLPIYYDEINPDRILELLNDDRIFVRQLYCLDVNQERIKLAVEDYYRAFTQRAKWLRDHLIIDDELNTYERKLIDAWRNYRLSLLDSLSAEETETELKNVGRKLLNWAQMSVDIRIRPDVDDAFVVRGSYHILADSKSPKVYWHPYFLERLKELLIP